MGSIILLALAIIFLPGLLDGKKEETKEITATIPIRPKSDIENVKTKLDEKIEELNQEELNQEDIVEIPQVKEAKETQQENTKQNSQTTKTNPNATKETAQAKESAWTIQLGVFKNQKNVANLVEKLKQAGYVTYTKNQGQDNNLITRVYVGPNLIKKRLENQLDDIKNLTGLSGKIYPFNPTR